VARDPKCPRLKVAARKDHIPMSLLPLLLLPRWWVYWFNTNRSHSSIGYDTPIEHENAYYHHHNPGQHQLTGEPSLH
jgi:transposase InsO family protein